MQIPQSTIDEIRERADIVDVVSRFVDLKRAGGTLRKHPNAKVFRDFRVMFDKMHKDIDMVSVSTPDHMHAPASAWAMHLGKHCYTQKPMTHSIYEARYLTELARKQKVATQMGNQAHAGEPIRRAVELIQGGMLGAVSEVHAWTNRPIWPQGPRALAELAKCKKTTPPASLDCRRCSLIPTLRITPCAALPTGCGHRRVAPQSSCIGRTIRSTRTS